MNAVATVVITTRDRVGDLRRALTSVYGQDCELECIVIDDASADGTAVSWRGRCGRCFASRGCTTNKRC